MTLLVPFDGSELSKAALRRARDFSQRADDRIVALSVIPPEYEYAVERGWVDGEEPFDPERVAERLRAQVEEIAPEAEYQYEVPDEGRSVASTNTDVVRTIRQVAHEAEATVVFVGSENAGRVSTPLCSVGAPVSLDPRYDVHIVRHAD